MSVPRHHPNARRPHPSRPLRLTAALLMCAGLVACSATQPPMAARTEAVVEATQFPQSGDHALAAGTYLVTTFAVPFQMTVPEGWEARDGWLLIKGRDDPEAVFLNFLIPRYVPTDACGWSGKLADVGPTVEGFADALAAQESTTMTARSDIAIDDHQGVQFDIAVDEEVVIQECGGSDVCIHSQASNHCTRYYQTVDRSETYRVLDLDGDRVILSRGQDEGAPATWVEEARAIFDSITFVTDE